MNSIFYIKKSHKNAKIESLYTVATMSVVNCKVKYIRPKYNNLREWMEDPNNVYIERKGVVFIDGARFPNHETIFANPFKIGKDGTRDEVIAKYREYIMGELAKNKDLLIGLKGKNLGCWCAHEPCHGDILMELINKN